MTLLLSLFTTVGAWATITGSGSKNDPYVLNDAADWEAFASNVNSGMNSGVYYKLSDTWDNSTSAVTTTVGTNSCPFMGTFNGNGKTLTLALTTDGNEYTAPFRYVDGATIKYLRTAGTVNGGNQKYATGLIGYAEGEVKIISCRSSVSIVSDRSEESNKDATHGGFIGVSGGSVTFTNCLFDGSITDNAATNCAGFVGWRNGTLTFNNCLMAGTITLYDTSGNNNGTATFNRSNSQNTTLNHCYYKTAYGTIQGTAVGETTNATLIDNDHLGSGWEISDNSVVPIMSRYNMASATVTGLDSKYPYNNGDAVAINYTVTDLYGTALTLGTHYNAVITKGNETVSSVTEKGDYVLTLTGISPYTGTKVLNFRVSQLNLTISSVDDWNTFASNVSEGEDYSGQTVKLADNFDNSATPITRMVGSIDHKFCGTFNGNGRTLTINLSAETDDCAPFLYLDGATVKDLTVAGTITTPERFGASIAAHNYGTTYINNCKSTVTIQCTATSSDDRTHGGFVAVNEGDAKLNFTSCEFRGEMLGSNATCNGGFVGWNQGTEINYSDCLFAPTELTMSTSGSCTFNRNGKYSLADSYFTKAFGEKQGKLVYTTAQSSFCDKIALNGNDYYHVGNAVITTPTRYEYNDGSPITVTPAMTYDGVELAADCYTATFTKDGEPVQTVGAKGHYTMTLTGNNSKGYYGSKSINFKLPWAENAPALSSTEGLRNVHLTATAGDSNGWEDRCQNLFDRDTQTKWCCYGYNYFNDYQTGVYVEFKSTFPFVPKGYSMTTANDNSENAGRNPASWKLMGKVNADDTEWTIIVEETGDQTMQDVNYTQYDFAVPSSVTTAFQYFRFEIYDTQGSLNGGFFTMQLSELSLWRAVDPNEPTYAINLPTVEHGTVTATVDGAPVTTAYKGDEVKLTIDWDKGYWVALDNFSIKDGNDQDVVDKYDYIGGNSYTYTFTMPASAVTVSGATISAILYHIWCKGYGSGEKFNIEVSTEEATVGQTVTLTINKADNVVMDNLTVSYYDYSSPSEQHEARRLLLRKDSQDEGKRKFVKLTKVDDTHYTFNMPPSSVEIIAELHYVGTYAINRAEGLPAEAVGITVDEIEVVSANADDKVQLLFNTPHVENLSVTGQSGAVDVNTDFYTFTMPAEAVTISADLTYQFCYITDGELSATVDNQVVENYGFIAPGKTITLIAKSSDSNVILSYLYVNNQSAGRVALTYLGETSEEGYPHVYTYTFVMPYNAVRVEMRMGNPMTVSFDANGGTGKMDDIIIGKSGMFAAPACGFTAPEGYSFAGWKPEYNDEIIAVGEDIWTGWGNLTIKAMWAKNITLANDADNDEVILDNHGSLANVTLSDRTLYKDGKWNTICLPFNVTLSDSPLDGAIARELTAASINGTTLNLTFDDPVDELVAGKPYIIKWANGTNLTGKDLVFNGVKIDVTDRSYDSKKASPAVTTDERVRFLGTYRKTTFESEDKSIIFLGAQNTLYYPQPSSNKQPTICAQRAYFKIGEDDIEWKARMLTAFNVNIFDEEDNTTGIAPLLFPEGDDAGASPRGGLLGAYWYDLSGRKLAGKPTKAGLYIYKGHKVAIK